MIELYGVLGPLVWDRIVLLVSECWQLTDDSLRYKNALVLVYIYLLFICSFPSEDKTHFICSCLLNIL